MRGPGPLYGRKMITAPRIVVGRWRWWKGIKKSRHSRRRLPPSRSHTEFAFGARTGVGRTRYPQIGKALVHRLREDAVPTIPPWDGPWRGGGESGGIESLPRGRHRGFGRRP